MDLHKNFRENPFALLSASPRDSRAELITKQGDMALFGEVETAENALSALFNPQHRLEAEIRWFPNTDPDEIEALWSYLERHPLITETPKFQTLSFTARFNELRLLLSCIKLRTVEELAAIFRSLALAADPLLPGQVMDELNADRSISGFPELNNKEAVYAQVRDLLSETVKAFIEQNQRIINKESARKLMRIFESDYTKLNSPYHNSYLLELAADELKLICIVNTPIKFN